MTEQYDVLIVGGGMVGAALGCALGESALRVAVLENTPPPGFSLQQDFDLRVSALSLATRNVMQAVGAWDGVLSRRHCPFRRMRVWESVGATEFCSDDIGEDSLGHIVENRVIQIALLERLRQFPNVDLLCPIETRRINYAGTGSSVLLGDGSELHAKLLVAADGGGSRVRQAAGIGVTSWDYRQHALVISVETGYVQQDITWQRFVPTGPQAFLPMPGSSASLVWYHSPDEIRRLQSLEDDQLLEQLVRAFPDDLGEIRRVIARGSFPLKRQHAQNYVKRGVALIGDAAHMINPLAGQGVNIGFLDAAALAQVLLDGNRANGAIESLEILREYEQMRRKDNLLMMTTMDLFYRVFSNTNPALRVFRNLGLGMAGRLAPARNRVMRYAIGLDGNLPALARESPVPGAEA